jgi:hypothetical protein
LIRAELQFSTMGWINQEYIVFSPWCVEKYEAGAIAPIQKGQQRVTRVI